MTEPSSRERETQDLIARFRAKRARRRLIRLAAACIGGIVFAAVVVVAVLLAAHTSGSHAAVGSTAASARPVSSSLTTSDLADSTTTTWDSGTTGGSGPATSDRATTSARSTTTTRATTRPSSTTTAHTTTTARSTSTTSRSTSTTARQASRSEKVVVIDPGHQARGNSSPEPIGPGSSETKPKVSDGTSGVATGTRESKLALTIGLRLRDALVAHGVKVVMTRTSEDVNLSNIQRAQIANKARADLFVRVHADGSDNPAISGIHVLYPASVKGWTDDIAAASKRAASLAQSELIAATGGKDRGIDARSDMTGFNWSDVPAIIPEIGFMTNAAEDRLLGTAAYQDKIVRGLTRAILEFLGTS